MTINDDDLRGRLRDLGRQVELYPPSPGLADRTRQTYRAQRRRRATLAAAGLVAALVLVGVPVATSSLLGSSGDGDTTEEPLLPLPDRGLYDVPTRGSLADDEAWVAGMRTLDWPAPDGSDDVPSTADRRVVFAGEVPGGRVALVLGRLEHRTVRAWFVGPESAVPGEMRPALAPAEMLDGQRLALWDAPDPAAEGGVLVVVAFPGDTAEFAPGVERPINGAIVETLEPLQLTDGVGIRTVPRPLGWPFATIVAAHQGDHSEGVQLDFSERAGAALGAPVVTDPRGLRGTVPQAWFDHTAGWLVENVGTPGESLPLTLLYAGGVRDTATKSAVLVGATLPTGATVVGLSVFTGSWSPTQTDAEKGAGGWGATTISSDPQPSGPPLPEQVVAVSVDGILTVSGPSGSATVDVLDADGRTVTGFPLVGGAGSSAIPEAAGVRIRDSAGSVVAEAPVTVVE